MEEVSAPAYTCLQFWRPHLSPAQYSVTPVSCSGSTSGTLGVGGAVQYSTVQYSTVQYSTSGTLGVGGAVAAPHPAHPARAAQAAGALARAPVTILNNTKS